MKKGKKRKFDAKTVLEKDKQYKSEPEESVDGDEEMSTDDDDCDDSGEYVTKSEQVEREKTDEDRRESPIQTEHIPPSPTTDTGIDVKVYEEVVAALTVVAATHSHFET
ncbi:hypothetical protein Scep_017609 [Stephania cephalantha]|uniref:Uncharacterized protein n=1 Tax=Stephania cephalantha TaxID=152367 RepID=A0AAP0NX40_9MAGN